MAVEGEEGPMIPPLGPAELPAVSAGPPLQLPGADPLWGAALVPGRARRKGLPVGEGIMGAGFCLLYIPQTGKWSWMEEREGIIRKEQKGSYARDGDTELERRGPDLGIRNGH